MSTMFQSIFTKFSVKAQFVVNVERSENTITIKMEDGTLLGEYNKKEIKDDVNSLAIAFEVAGFIENTEYPHPEIAGKVEKLLQLLVE